MQELFTLKLFYVFIGLSYTNLHLPQLIRFFTVFINLGGVFIIFYSLFQIIFIFKPFAGIIKNISDILLRFCPFQRPRFFGKNPLTIFIIFNRQQRNFITMAKQPQ